jgi:hypothetical protein
MCKTKMCLAVSGILFVTLAGYTKSGRLAPCTLHPYNTCCVSLRSCCTCQGPATEAGRNSF